ncbi:hypothetical protein, partial [Pseudomonas syringae]|uniref:hypothetical protein n=2 Tax=Pseudomonas syringae TaxID=317 RepID=UPI001E394F5C
GKPDPHFLPGGVCGADTFGQRKWAVKAGDLLNPEKPDHLSYLAAVFTFAPECWHLCTRRVYELHASGAYSSTR